MVELCYCDNLKEGICDYCEEKMHKQINNSIKESNAKTTIPDRLKFLEDVQTSMLKEIQHLEDQNERQARLNKSLNKLVDWMCDKIKMSKY